MSRLINMITAVSLLLVLAGLPAHAVVPDIDAPGIERAMEVQEEHTDSLMAIEGVVGTAVGADARGRAVIRVLIKHSGVAGIPTTLDGFKVVPLVTGEFFARKGPPGGGGGGGGGGGVDPTARFDRPVPIGVSTGHPAVTAGTIGARVIDDNGNVYALSNNHVYADENAASIGDAVIQPGAIDGGSLPDDKIGTLAAFEPIDFNGLPNTIDAAISSTTNLGNSTPSDGYGTPSSTIADAVIGMGVKKYGRTTGQTAGSVDLINVNVNVGYDTGTAFFMNQIAIKPGKFSAGGDSGSLIVSNVGDNPVCLLFAGSRRFTICSPIDAVLDSLRDELNVGNLTIDGN